MNPTPAITRLTDLEHNGLGPYRTLRRQEAHLKEGIFVAEGEKVVRRLMASGLAIRSMLLTPQWYSSLFQDEPTGPGVPVYSPGAAIYIAEKSLLESIVGFSLHQGIMAVGMTPGERPLAEYFNPGLRDRILCVALDDLVNAENVGLVIRNCAAFGADPVICGETSGNAYLRRSVRASMGTVFGANIVHSRDIVETLGLLRGEFGVRLIAADPAGPEEIYRVSMTGPVCVVVGHEGTGIRRKVLDVCDVRAAIPMWSRTDSLNVSSACAVFLAEARRQRLTP